MQIKDASCGWNLMSLKICWVNFILPRNVKKKKSKKYKCNLIEHKPSLEAVRVCGWSLWKPDIVCGCVCGARAFIYTLSAIVRRGTGSNDLTEIQEKNWAVWHFWIPRTEWKSTPEEKEFIMMLFSHLPPFFFSNHFFSEHAQRGQGGWKIMTRVLLVLTVWFFDYGLNAKDSSLL